MKKIVNSVICLLLSLSTFAIDVDYSVMAVPEERSLDLACVTQPNDYVALPQVKRKRNGINWLANRVINVSPDGKNLAFVSNRDGKTNIFVKEVGKVQGSTQRTNRSNIIDFNYSPDGQKISFAENRGNGYQIFVTDANQGFVCQQYTSGGDDYSPVFSPDMKNVYFTRMEGQGCSIWSCNIANGMLSSYTTGFNPNPVGKNTLICARMNGEGRGEIWSIDLAKGAETCLLSDLEHSFTSPAISPDGKWIACVGSTAIPMGNNKFYYNTDIYLLKTDGSNLHQLTYHAADDLSPVWSPDGSYIYFVSQRGNPEGHPNIWRVYFSEHQIM